MILKVRFLYLVVQGLLLLCLYLLYKWTRILDLLQMFQLRFKPYWWLYRKGKRVLYILLHYNIYNLDNPVCQYCMVKESDCCNMIMPYLKMDILITVFKDFIRNLSWLSQFLNFQTIFQIFLIQVCYHSFLEGIDTCISKTFHTLLRPHRCKVLN